MEPAGDRQAITARRFLEVIRASRLIYNRLSDVGATIAALAFIVFVKCNECHHSELP